MKLQYGYRQLVFFLAGFLIGVLYIFFVGTELRSQSDFLNIQSLMQITYSNMEYRDYFPFLLKKRFGIIALLGLFSMTAFGKYLVAAFLMYFGISVGSMLSLTILRYGLKGIFLFLALIFPQDLVYVPVLYQWIGLFMLWHRRLFGQYYSLPVGKQTKRMGGKLLLLLGVTIIGILLECYVNPMIVITALKLF